MSRPRRSALFLPASNPRAIAKARGLDCDAVILDLEDAVAPDAKAEARAAAVEAVRQGDWGHREIVVRVNAVETEWGATDLAALVGSGIDAVLLPKLSSPDTLAQARGALGDRPALWAMIETPRGVLDLPRIVDAGQGLAVLVAGTNDLAKELRCRPGPDRTALLPALSHIVIAGRAAGLMVLDGVSNVIGDPDAVEAECRQGRDLGFDGKSLIHPSQIDPANRVFSPDEAEVEWARKTVAAFEGEERGVIRLDGQMVERLHVADAERVLKIHRATRR
jgi:citrate lyase subunit beta/citryl-CoA lyase